MSPACDEPMRGLHVHDGVLNSVGMHSRGVNAPRRSRRILEKSAGKDKRTQNSIVVLPDKRHTGGRKDSKNDEANWRELKESQCYCIRTGGTSISEPGNACYIRASLQCFFESAPGALLRKMRGCKCSLESCPSCLLREETHA